MGSLNYKIRSIKPSDLSLHNVTSSVSDHFRNIGQVESWKAAGKDRAIFCLGLASHLTPHTEPGYLRNVWRLVNNDWLDVKSGDSENLIIMWTRGFISIHSVLSSNNK